MRPGAVVAYAHLPPQVVRDEAMRLYLAGYG